LRALSGHCTDNVCFAIGPAAATRSYLGLAPHHRPSAAVALNAHHAHVPVLCSFGMYAALSVTCHSPADSRITNTTPHHPSVGNAAVALSAHLLLLVSYLYYNAAGVGCTPS
jgi:hypothetical protein